MPRKAKLRAVLAQNVRRITADRGMQLNALADFAGVSRSHLYAVLACQRAATVDWIEKVAEALEVEVVELLDSPR